MSVRHLDHRSGGAVVAARAALGHAVAHNRHAVRASLVPVDQVDVRHLKERKRIHQTTTRDATSEIINETVEIVNTG